MGVFAGARALSAEGLEKLRWAAAVGPILLGLDLREVAQFTRLFKPVDRGVLPVIDTTVPVLHIGYPP
jgi:hypothetical protein